MKIDLTDYLSGDYRSYSGRGMQGKHCKGFVYESMREAIHDMLLAVASLDEQDDRDAMVKQLEDYRSDSLGTEIILYFPKDLVSEEEIQEEVRDRLINEASL